MKFRVASFLNHKLYLKLKSIKFPSDCKMKLSIKIICYIKFFFNINHFENNYFDYLVHYFEITILVT